MSRMTVQVAARVGGGKHPIPIDCGTQSLGQGDALTIVLPDVPMVMELAGKPIRVLYRGKWFTVGEELEP